MPAKPSALLDTRVIYGGDNLDQLRKLPVYSSFQLINCGVPPSLGLSNTNIECLDTALFLLAGVLLSNQTANSANAGTISFYVTIWPLP